MKPYEQIEHTADIGLRVYGKTKNELFINAAKGLFSLLVPGYNPKPQFSKEIILSAANYEVLLINFLNDLLSYFYAESFLPADYRLNLENLTLKAQLKGEKFSFLEHDMPFEIKAATYHNVKIEKEGGYLKTEVIFDV